MSQAVPLRLLASLSCSGETRGIRSREVRRVLLRIGALHETSEPEQAEEDLLGGQQQRVRWVWNIFCVINQGSAQRTLGACQKDTEASERDSHWSNQSDTAVFSRLAGFCPCLVNEKLSLNRQWKSVPRGFFPTFSLRQSPAVRVSPLLLQPLLVLVVPLLLSGHDFWALIPFYPPVASQPYVWLQLLAVADLQAVSSSLLGFSDFLLYV